MLDFSKIYGKDKWAVHCKTKEDAELLFAKIWEKHPEVVLGTTWTANDTRFGHYTDTVYIPCIGVPNGILKYGSYKGAERMDYTIIPFSDLYAEPEYDEAEMQFNFDKLFSL